ncbi:PGDYG domain-containing protein, partial [Rhizobium leguminosarum]|uniref:PGDYG domain-containing protein n=1 Tax=Rhizobium leguminosarum TaxID=384 RepID=UPI003F9B79E5
VRALKKPIPITAKKINEPFTVDTSEGTMSGKAGDWLMQGINGEMYICPATIFEMSYDIIK